MKPRRSNRAVGQYFRNLKDVDPWTLLCMRALNRAWADAEAIACYDEDPVGYERKFQPGIAVKREEIEAQRKKLLVWVKGESFRIWTTYLGEKTDERREEIEELLNAGKKKKEARRQSRVRRKG